MRSHRNKFLTIFEKYPISSVELKAERANNPQTTTPSTDRPAKRRALLFPPGKDSEEMFALRQTVIKHFLHYNFHLANRGLDKQTPTESHHNQCISCVCMKHLFVANIVNDCNCFDFQLAEAFGL